MVVVSREKTKLADSKVADYLSQLKSKKNSVGSGPVDALTGAQAVTMLINICNITADRDDYSDSRCVFTTAKNSLEPILKDYIDGIDKGAEAAETLKSALKMDEESDVSKRAKNEAISRGSVEAVEAPLRNMDLTLKALIIAATIKKKFPPELAPEYGSAVLCLRACVYGAWMNVRANLVNLHDPDTREHYDSHGFEVVRKAAKLSEELYVSANKMI